MTEPSRRWSAAEDRRLQTMYRSGRPVAEIVAALGRSPDAVVSRRRLLGLRSRRRVWTADIDEQLVEAASLGRPISALASPLGLPADALRRRTRRLVGAAPAARPYSASDDALLRAALAQDGGLERAAQRMGRTPGALQARARALGLVPAASPRARWTVEEDRLVRFCHAEGQPFAVIAAQLPHPRTVGAVAARAQKLGLRRKPRRWSDEDERRLRQLREAGVPTSLIARELERSPEAVRIRIRRLTTSSARGA